MVNFSGTSQITIDFNESVAFEDEYFFDMDHLNDSGAAWLTLCLEKLLM